MNYYQNIRLVLLLLSLGSFSPVTAEPDNTDLENSPAEKRYQQIKTSVQDIADWLDNLFLDERTETESAWSRLIIRFDSQFIDGEDTNLDIKIRGKVVLPNLDRRVQLIFDDDADGDETIPGDKKESSSGIRFLLSESMRERLYLGGGFRGGFTNPTSYVRFQYRYQQQEGNNIYRFRPTVIWDSRKGWHAYMRIAYEKKITDKLFFRTSATPLIKEKTSGWSYNHDFTLYKRMSKHRFLMLHWSNNIKSQPSLHLDSSYLRLRMRREIWKNRLFVEAGPGVRFLDKNNHDAQYEFFARIELLFSKDIK